MQRSYSSSYGHSAGHSLVISLGFPLAVVSSALWTTAAQANTITAASDGTGTVVTQQDNHFTVEQGSFSTDGLNQFHSLESFSVEAGESVNFVAPAAVQNVLTKVSGVAPSVIDGSVQVAGEQQPNLYLMNPAGVLIGPDANINLPGNLTVTTAESVGFEDGRFSAVEENTYENLTGTPTGDFVFSGNQPGAIVNEGSLSLAADAELTLLGGTVVNTGEINVPGGEITLAAVPGESIVRLRSPDSLLTLEISPQDLRYQTTERSSFSDLNSLDLPALLVYSEQSTATQLVTHADGTVSLTNGSNSIEPGDVAGAGVLSAASDEGVGGSIALSGDRVSLFDADLSVSGQQGGGTIRVGGDYRGQPTLPTATATFLDAQTVLSADALQQGSGGQVSIWANDTTQYFGSITAIGGEDSGNGGAVEVSGKQTLLFEGVVDTSAPKGQLGSLLLDPENIVIVNGLNAADDDQLIDYSITADEDGDLFTISERTLSRLAVNSTLTLEANNNIIVEPLLDQVLSFRPGTGAITLKADADGNGVGNFIMSDPDTTLIAPGRDISISGANLLLGDLNTAALFQGGAITLNATGSITTGDIDTKAPTTVGRGGNVSIAAANITTREIFTRSPNQSGNVALTGTVGDITTGKILADSLEGVAGVVELSGPNNIWIDGELIQGAPAVEESLPPVPPESPSDEASQTAGLSAAGLANLLKAVQGIGQSSDSSGGSDSGGASSKAAAAGAGGTQATVLSAAQANVALANFEGVKTQQFSSYLGQALEAQEQTLEDIQQMLTKLANESGNRSAVVYVKAPASGAEAGDSGSDLASTEDADMGDAEDILELMLITADSPAVKIEISDVQSDLLAETVSTFRADLLTSVRRGGAAYLSSAKTLYDWLVAPVEAALADVNGGEAADIDTLAYAMDTGLRALPIAALHDGEQFLVEKYSLGMLPSLGLANIEYASLAGASVTAMGASTFDTLDPLPAVPLELEYIHSLWPGSEFLNENFTRQNLIEQQAQSPSQIVHLATHAEFNAGSIEDSFIQLWNDPLRLSDLSELGWEQSAVDLLVLSACRTAVGSPEAELGFAGLALASGARSAMASLWSVDDVGTLALMSEFYRQLGTLPTKAEALRAAQLALLNGDLQIASGQLLNSKTQSALSLPSSLGTLEESNFSHPYYWSGFTMIGNPW